MKKVIAIILALGSASAGLTAQSNVAQFKQLFRDGNYGDLFDPLLNYMSSLGGNANFELDYMMGVTLCNLSGYEDDGRAYLDRTQQKFSVSAQIFDGHRVSLPDAIRNCNPVVAGVATGESQPRDPGVSSIMKKTIDIRSQQQILNAVKTRKTQNNAAITEKRSAVIKSAGAIYDGEYRMVHDGWKGQLLLRGPAGKYVDSAGKPYRVLVRFFPDHKIVFYVVGLGGENADGTGGQKFEAYLFTQTKDGMAGTTWWQNQPFGFYAVRK